MTKTTKKLYGVSVPLEKFETLKKLADILAKETYTNVSIKEARRRATVVAIQALINMSPHSSWFLEMC